MIATFSVLSPRGVRTALVLRAMRELLDENALLAMATAYRDRPHANSAFYFRANGFRLGFLSFSTSRHIRYSTGKDAAVSIATSAQCWAGPLKGLQLTGRVSEVQARQRRDFLRRYAARFEDSRPYCEELLANARPESAKPYYFEIKSFTLLDELRFGDETFVRGVVRRA